MQDNVTELNGIKCHPFDSFDSLLDYATNTDNPGKILVAINAEKILNSTDLMKGIINRNIGYADGSGAVIALKQKGFKKAAKLPGCELWLKIVAKCYKTQSFYLVGATQETIEQTVKGLQKDFKGINIVGYRNGYILSNEQQEALIKDIVEKKPNIVFVAMGSPKQEILMEEIQKQHRAIYLGLGGSFDVFTGKVERAPKWWIDHNMEFMYRLIKQPKRIKRQIHLLKYAWWLLIRKL